jgi:hypothetical protein
MLVVYKIDVVYYIVLELPTQKCQMGTKLSPKNYNLRVFHRDDVGIATYLLR